jgi:hypothetical protein
MKYLLRKAEGECGPAFFGQPAKKSEMAFPLQTAKRGRPFSKSGPAFRIGSGRKASQGLTMLFRA